MKFFVSGNAPINYPAETLFGVLRCSDEDALEIPYEYPLYGEWGHVLSNIYEEPKDVPLPQSLDVVYLSIVEQKFYSVEAPIEEKIIKGKWEEAHKGQKENQDVHIVVGLAPYGLTALWIHENRKSVLVSVFKAKPVEVRMADFRAADNITLHEVCQRYINRLPHVKRNLEQKGLPRLDLLSGYMRQFVYRFLFIPGKWGYKRWTKEAAEEERTVLDYIEEALYDGTHDKLHDGGLMKYHRAGKPKKLRIQWHIGKSEYSAYFWFDDERIREVFDRFYGAHPDTKTDFIIRIDAEQKKYELALYRYGLKEPQIVPEDVYQLLVFKNKFEDFHSDNYSQERGAWIW